MKVISFGISHRPGKKHMVVIRDTAGKNHTIHFGASGYTDFTQTRNEVKKAAYLARHSKNEDWNNPLTAGFWSRWVLWNKPSIHQSLIDVKQRFNL
jgi:hypothetical protein